LRILPLVKKEFRQVSRDVRTLGVLLLVPIFLLAIFGYAISLEVKHIPLAVYDGDRSRESRIFIESFLHSEHFDLKAVLGGLEEVDGLMGRERIKAALILAPGFSKKLLSGQEAAVQVVVDGTNATNAATALGYIQAIIQNGSSPPVAAVDYRPRIWFNPELRSSFFLVPGLIAFIMVISAVISTSLSVVREKERGTLEQILISPITPLELVVGKTVPYMLISLVSTLGTLLASVLLFGLTVKGSLLLLLLVTLLFLAGSLGLGVLISTIAGTQQVAFIVSVILTVLPTFVLSGFVFPIRNMPAPIRALTYLFPARYFLAALRSIILKGAGLAAFWDQALDLFIFASLTLAASTLRLRGWRL